MNIKFSYFYRDKCNFKEFGEVVFSNSEDLNLEETEETLRSFLEDGEFFIGRKIGIPDLEMAVEDSEFAPDFYYEFEGLSFTEEVVSDILYRTYCDFMTNLENMLQ